MKPVERVTTRLGAAGGEVLEHLGIDDIVYEEAGGGKSRRQSCRTGSEHGIEIDELMSVTGIQLVEQLALVVLRAEERNRIGAPPQLICRDPAWLHSARVADGRAGLLDEEGQDDTDHDRCDAGGTACREDFNRQWTAARQLHQQPVISRGHEAAEPEHEKVDGSRGATLNLIRVDLLDRGVRIMAAAQTPPEPSRA